MAAQDKQVTGDIVEFIVDISAADSLTGLMSRSAFIDRGRHDIARRDRYGAPLSCMILDIDYLRAFNDNHGLAAGDLVLQQVAAICTRFLRGGDYVGRIGDDEFAVMMPGRPLLHAVNAAERLQTNIAAEAVTVRGSTLGFTVSVGVAESPRWAASIEDLLEAAGCAVRDAKADGRNRVGCFFESDLRVSSSFDRVAV
jgi:diguanylate cyclase (GGDEF)-like protein